MYTNEEAAGGRRLGFPGLNHPVRSLSLAWGNPVWPSKAGSR